MNILDGVKLDFDDVLIVPKRSVIESRADVSLDRKFIFKHSKKEWQGIPLIAANMDTVASFEMAKALDKHKAMTALHKFYTIDELENFFNNNGVWNNVFYSMGISESDLAKLKDVSQKINNHITSDNSFPRFICLDVANGYTKLFNDTAKRVRETYPKATIMAGNVVTPNMVEQLIQECGVDIVKVGIGGGSACTTRLVAGVGYPQFSAIIECKDAAHGLGGLICSDGGCRTPADVVKAWAAGADFVMLGGMLAGTDECCGEWEYEIIIEGKNSRIGDKKSMKFYGMSSREAQEKHYGCYAKHRASEGRVAKVDYKGPVDNVIQEVLGGVRSACAYVGATKLKDLDKCATFVRCSRTHNSVYEK